MIITLCGLPASGKTTLAKTFEKYGYKRHSFDDNPNQTLQQYCDNIQRDHEAGYDIICDLMLVEKESRLKFLQGISSIECEKRIIVLNTPYDVCLARNRQRQQPVLEILMKARKNNFTYPTSDEGWNKILYKT